MFGVTETHGVDESVREDDVKVGQEVKTAGVECAADGRPAA